MQLTRLDPFLELDQLQKRLNRLFLDPSLKSPEPPFANFVPAVDIQETDGEFIVKVDLPEVKKEEVKVQVLDGVLAIEGERRTEKEEKGKRFHKVERECGKFVRRFTMPTEIDAANVHAEFKDGVLKVLLPKAPSAKPKLIDVKVE
jgi:HSP20 family protein